MLRLTLLLTLMWLPAFLFGYERWGEFFFWRHQLIMLTGILSIGYMGVAVLLATRFERIEALVKGLDKGYAIHKRLGIGATIALISHWLVIKSAHWLIEAGWLASHHHSRTAIEGINWHALAKQVGEISFYVFLVFSAISLIQLFSYRNFKWTHKIAGLLMIAGIFHGVLLLDWNVQSFPMNLATIVLSVGGFVGSVWSLTGQIGKSKKVTARVVAIERDDGGVGEHQMVRFSLQLDGNIQYQEGQFCYLNFHDGESPHPFSVLNYEPEKQLLEFGVRDLGDYTHKLVNQLETDQRVTVEGGYGRFQMSEVENQVWVGAGIGIVPFISRLYWLKRRAGPSSVTMKKVHLFYCVNTEKEAFFAKEIRKLITGMPFLEFHLFDAKKGEILSADDITTKMTNDVYDVSFCGPEKFGQHLQHALTALGLPASNFHRELFKMR